MKPKDALISGSLLAGGTNKVQARRRSCAFAGVMSSLLALAAAPAYAAAPGDIQSFVDCLNSSNAPNQTVADVVACVPSNCKTTVTLSEESGQPACTLRDGTRLPRVIFSCPGPNGSQTFRFRPSFSLCTQGGIINHIEVGEDVNKSTRTDDPALRNFPYVQKMADIVVGGSQYLTLFGSGKTAVLDAKSPANKKGCSECHDKMGTLTVAPASIANLFLPIPSAVADGTIYTDDPAVDSSGVPQTPLIDICTGIWNSTQLANSMIPGLKDLAFNLCTALKDKIHP
jgi:hypothetical protein